MKKVWISIIAFLSCTTAARAQQWSDAIQWEEANIRAPFASMVSQFPGYSGWPTTPTTNLAIPVQGFSCPTTAFPSFAGTYPFGPTNIPSSCGNSSGMYIDLNQFARVSDVRSMFADLASQIRTSYAGIAEALALGGTARLQEDEHFAVSLNFGAFGGQNAFAAGGAVRIADHWSFNGGLSGPIGGGPIGGQAGIRFGW